MNIKQIVDGLKNKQDALSSIPKIEIHQFWMLFTHMYYDGIINGVMSYEGKKYWFEMFDEFHELEYDKELDDYFVKDNDWYRRYAVVEVSHELMQEAIEVNEDFVKYVGSGNQHSMDDIFENKHRIIGKLKEEASWKLFYEKHPRDYESTIPDRMRLGKVVAWFEI
jgi:DNA primase large subunit